MSSRNWSKHKQRALMRRNGTEERDQGSNLPPVTGARRGPVMSKEQLRREADRLLAGYGGPVTRVKQGARAIPEAVPDHQRGRNVNNCTQKRVAKRSNGLDNSRSRGRRKKRGPDTVNVDSMDVSHGLVIYCDGACEPNPGAGGWGFVVYRDGVEIHSDCGGSEMTTNNIMEMTGALMALRWFADRGIIEPVRLLCDSKYVVNGCNEWRHKWKRHGWRKTIRGKEIKNSDLWRELDEALTLVPITLEWCKGHAGIVGNERADELSLIGREKALETVPAGISPLIKQQLAYEVV